MTLSDALDALKKQGSITAYQSRLIRHQMDPLPAMPDSARAILARVSEETGVAVRDMIGPDKHANIVVARHAAFAAMRALGWSFPRIGQIMRRDHATIQHGVRMHRSRQPAVIDGAGSVEGLGG